ncbi:MAG: hypothetical protein K2L48_03605 [Mycoplasmoidaceae bacterium]|nr:hypothetical protein [Mycoplasmoidaceae bacterium]
MLKNNFLSSISTDKNQVFQLSCISCYRKIFPCLRDDDISIDVSKKIDLEIDSYNLEDSSITCDISMYTKVNTNSDNQNSLLTFNYDEARCKIKTTFISKRFDISNISDDFRSTLNDVFPSTKTVDSNEIIPWVNINSVPASYIRQYIYDRLSNKFLTLLEAKYTPFAYSISGEDYTPYLSYFNFDVIPANTQIKDKYDLSKPVLFKIQIIPLLGSLFYGSIGLSSSVSDAMLIQLKSVNYSVSLNQLSVQQDSIFSLFSVPGESANKVPKERLLSLLDNNSELSVILENKISSLLETDYRPKRDDKKISLDYDYSLSIENYSSFNNYIDFSKTVCVSIKIEANSSSIYLRDSKILNF